MFSNEDSENVGAALLQVARDAALKENKKELTKTQKLARSQAELALAQAELAALRAHLKTLDEYRRRARPHDGGDTEQFLDDYDALRREWQAEHEEDKS